jgi:c(7)-type cytochrome triheme protein
MRSRSALIGLTAAAGLSLTLLAAAQPARPVKIPGDFAYESAEGSPGPVKFGHRTHLAKVEKCTTCHFRTFKMRRGGSGPITLVAKQEGKLCGACHDGQPKRRGVVAFPIDACDRCHVP